MRDAKTSVALYYVSSDVDGAKIVQQMGIRSNKTVVQMLESARDSLATDSQLVASMLQGPDVCTFPSLTPPESADGKNYADASGRYTVICSRLRGKILLLTPKGIPSSRLFSLVYGLRIFERRGGELCFPGLLVKPSQLKVHRSIIVT
jgi:hypothetical protein